MARQGPDLKGYFLAAALGAIGGGMAIALGTRALPTMMARMMETWRRHMMQGFGEASAQHGQPWREGSVAAGLTVQSEFSASLG